MPRTANHALERAAKMLYDLVPLPDDGGFGYEGVIPWHEAPVEERDRFRRLAGLATTAPPPMPANVDQRLQALERHSHEPYDFTHLRQRLTVMEQKLGIAPSPEKES